MSRRRVLCASVPPQPPSVPRCVLVALLHRALARYTSISARASETRRHDGAPPSPRWCGPRSVQAVRAASEHVHHSGARSRSAPAQRSCAEALCRRARASACAEGSREWRIGEGRRDTGRTYILRRREVYSVCARPQSWNAPPSARWSCASASCEIQSAPDTLSGQLG
jgi:hypothetical protein